MWSSIKLCINRFALAFQTDAFRNLNVKLKTLFNTLVDPNADKMGDVEKRKNKDTEVDEPQKVNKNNVITVNDIEHFITNHFKFSCFDISKTVINFYTFYSTCVKP